MEQKNGKSTRMKIAYGSKVLDLSEPKVMGIINLTTDSFYDGWTANNSLKHAEKMITEGADILDIGAVSTRPGAVAVNEEEELRRLIAPLKEIVRHFPGVIISVDTYRSKTARMAIESGAHMINDISGGTFDDDMFKVIASYKIPYILMHIQGTPENMQVNPVYTDVVADIKNYFKLRLKVLEEVGITNNIILDPGFGFGKTPEHNYRLLNDLHVFTGTGHPVLAGVSRKSMINRVLGVNPSMSLNGTTVINTIALLNGASILRVHDVREAKEAIKLVSFCKNLTRD